MTISGPNKPSQGGSMGLDRPSPIKFSWWERYRLSFVWNYRGHNGGWFDRGPNWFQITVPGSRNLWRCALICTERR